MNEWREPMLMNDDIRGRYRSPRVVFNLSSRKSHRYHCYASYASVVQEKEVPFHGFHSFRFVIRLLVIRCVGEMAAYPLFNGDASAVVG